MNKLEQYILKQYGNSPDWFKQEVELPYNMLIQSHAVTNKLYLEGQHEILKRTDSTYQDKVFKTTKLILQNSKTIENFHSSLLMGKNVSLSGSDNLVEEMNKVYRNGYHKANFNIVQNLFRYGNSYEYNYIENNKIKCKILNSEDCCPIYDNMGEYIGLINHFTDAITNISVYVIYSEDKVTTYSDEGGSLVITNQANNLSGLPVHYKQTFSDAVGKSSLEDIKPILDTLEVILSKGIDSIQTLSMNPLAYTSGQRINEGINSTGGTYCLSLEDGATFGYAQSQLDSQSIKLILDQLHLNLNIVAQIPSVVLGASNPSNISEVSLELLFCLSYNQANLTKQYLDNFNTRHEQIIKLMAMKGIEINEAEFIDVVYNYSKPSDTGNTIDMLSKMYNDGTLSKQSYAELSPLINNSDVELERLKGEIEVRGTSDTKALTA